MRSYLLNDNMDIIMKWNLITKRNFFFLICYQFFLYILTSTNCLAESSFPRIIFRSPYCANTNMPEDSISYYFNQVKSLGANSIIGVCDSLSTKYGKKYGISIIPFNQYGGNAKKVKVTERDRQYIEDLTTYGFYLDLQAENNQLSEGYAFYQDPSVSIEYQDDDTVGQWCKVADHDSGLVIEGPTGGSVFTYSPLLLPTTQCSANYVMKIGDKEGDPNAEVARLIITDPDSCIEWEGSICVARLTWTRSVKVSDFDQSGVYDTLGISFTQRRWHRFYYELFWTDVKDLWVDKVILSNSTGQVLFSLTEDSVETPLQNYYSSLDTQLHSWYLLDEPDGGSLPAMKWANELIGSVQLGTWDPSDTTSIFTTLTRSRAVGIAGDLYLSDIEAKEFNVDYYPYHHTHTALRQEELDGFCASMDTCSKKARNYGKSFYATIQVHAWDVAQDTVGEERDTLTQRNPTPEEIKAEAYLALAHGAKGLAYFWYTTTYYSKDKQGIIQDTSDWRGLGLVVWSPDSARWIPNEKWFAVQSINHYLDKIGSIFLELNWKGAYRSDTVEKLDFSFIKEIKSDKYDTSYIQLGFFKNDLNNDYFMLVNRRCLEDESQSVTCYIEKSGEYMIIDLFQDDTVLVDYNESLGAITFTTRLEPGQGKLFKLVPR